MAGKGHKIHAQRLHINRHVGGALGGVHHHHGAVLVGQINDGFHWIGAAKYIGHLRHSHQSGFVCDLRFQLRHRQAAIRCTFQIAQGGAGLPGNHPPGQHIGVVLRNAYHDLVLRADSVQAVAVCHQVQALCGVAGKDNFAVAFGVQKTAHRLSGGGVVLRSVHTQLVQTPQGVGVVGLVKFALGVQHAVRALAGGGVIQVGYLALPQQGKVCPVIHHFLLGHWAFSSK